MSPPGRLAALCCLLLAGCAQAHPPAPANLPRPLLSYLGQAQVPFGATFDGTVIGGLSAISYDAGRQLYYVISDDRSARNPARFYAVQLSFSNTSSGSGIEHITFTGTHPFLDQSGQPFRPLTLNTTPPVVPPDPEGIAFDPVRQRLYWSSEGERLTEGPGAPVLLDPWVRTAALDGAYLGQFALPPNLAMSAQQAGPRRDRALEGVALTPDGQSLFVAMEDPGYNDGPERDDDHQIMTRFTKFDVATGAAVAQYAYPMQPPAPPAVENGVPDLVALSDTSFLVLERTDSVPQTVRVYRAEIGGATDVLAMPSINGVALTPMTKSLAVDMTTTPGLSPLDNVEGITLGPKLPDGRQSVVFVSDNNFSPTQVTQFLLFAM
jgi:hypothetical protein